MRRYLLALVFLFSAVTTPLSTLRAANGDVSAVSGSGTLNNIDLFRVTPDGSVIFSTSTAGNYQVFTATGAIFNKNIIITGPNDISFGSPVTAVSSTTSSGSSQGMFFTAYLGGSTAALEGSVLIATTQVSGQGLTVVVAPAVSNQTNWVGVALAAVSTGSVVNIFDEGWALALTTGTVNPGDMLKTSSLSAGYLDATTTSTHSIVGIALGAGTAAGATTKVRLR